MVTALGTIANNKSYKVKTSKAVLPSKVNEW